MVCGENTHNDSGNNFTRRLQTKCPRSQHHLRLHELEVVPAAPSKATMLFVPEDELLPAGWIAEKGRYEGERSDVFWDERGWIWQGFCFSGCGEDVVDNPRLILQK